MNRARKTLPRLRHVAVAIASCFSAAAVALPTAPTVTNGSASFRQSGGTLTVTNTSGATIHWNSFSIGQGETTHFIQPSASSSVLNRVLGPDPSQIYGTLSSNGRIFLINPAGIYVGPGGRVDAAGFVASSLALSDQDFLAGRLAFSRAGAPGGVENHGTISTPDGGQVYLVAPQVANHGTISAPGGEVVLAAGAAVHLVNTATPGVTVELSASDEAVRNFGRVDAARIGLAGAVARNAGTLNASSVVSEGGRVFLRATRQVEVDAEGRIVANGTRGGTVELHSDDLTLVSGRVEANGSSGEGGRIEALGDKVAIFSGAALDASGRDGGGTILVGGDLQGANPALRNAAVSWLGADAELRADAVEAGDGGKIIVWADDTTRAHGRISARGGATGGDGGFAEVSGKRHLDFQAAVDVGAPQGTAGTLLLDPMSVSIIYGTFGPPNPAAFYGDATWFETADPATSTTLNWLTYGGAPGIGALLDAGTNVVITTAGAYGAGTGDISLAYAGGVQTYSWSSTAKLSLLAYGGISINNPLVGANGSLFMMAGWDQASGTASPALGSNPVSPSITALTDGVVQVPTVTATALGSVTLTNINNRINDLTATSVNGSINYIGGNAAGPNDLTLRDLQASNGSITVSTNNTYGGNITLGSLVASTGYGGNVSVTARRAILEDDVGVRDVLAYGASLTSVQGATGPSTLGVSADVEFTWSLNASVSAGASYGGLRIANAGGVASDTTGFVSLSDGSSYGGTTSYLGKGDIDIGVRHTFGNLSGLGALQVSTPQDLYVSGTVSNFENITLSAGTNLETGIIGTVTASKVAALSAGNLLWVDSAGTVNGAEGVGLSAPLVLIEGVVNSSAGAISIVADTLIVDGTIGPGLVSGNAGVSAVAGSNIFMTDGTISTGANLTVNGDIVLMSGGDVRLDTNSLVTNAKASPAPLANVFVSAGVDLRLHDNSRIVASDDLYIELSAPNSTLVLNETNLVAPSYLLTDVASGLVGTTYLNFLARSAGGIVVDGVETTSWAAYGSGIFHVDTARGLASGPGNGLSVLYGAGGVDPVAKEIGGIFDSGTRDTESINDISNEEVDALANEMAEEKEGEDGNGEGNQEGAKDGKGGKKLDKC